MFCGAGSFSRLDDDPSSQPMPRGLRQKHGSSSNPYSTRGLDKFSTVLADLQSRREQIMAKAGSKGVSAVRFAYSNSHDSWVPIVVKPREQRPELGKPQEGAAAEARRGPDVAAKERQAPPPPELTNAAGTAPTPPVQNRVVEKSFSWKAGSREGRGSFRWKPSSCWPTVVVLILLCLAFGRAFAICCTSIWWYSVPSMKADEDPNVRKPMKKDYRRGELARRSRELAANTKKDGDLAGLASPRHHQTSTAKRRPC